MPSDNQQSQAGYFKGTLISGLTPFLYRNRVRSLLGIPAARTNKVSACTVLPPVGFRYTNQRIFAGPPGTNQFTEATVQTNFSSRISNDGRKLDKSGLESDQRANTADHLGGSFKDDAENSNASNISRRYEGPPKAFETRAGDKDLSIESVKIPGISNNRQPFSPLDHLEEEVPLPVKKVKQVRQPIETSPGERINDKGAPEPESKTGPANYIEEQVGDRTESINSRASSLLQKNISFKKKETKHPRLVPRSSISPHSSFNLTTRTNPEASDKIEKLRQTFHEIAKKQSTLTKEQTSRITQPSPQKAASHTPPSQSVIIYKQRPYKSKTPCAFWERSYMSRINIRTLR